MKTRRNYFFCLDTCQKAASVNWFVGKNRNKIQSRKICGNAEGLHVYWIYSLRKLVSEFQADVFALIKWPKSKYQRRYSRAKNSDNYTHSSCTGSTLVNYSTSLEILTEQQIMWKTVRDSDLHNMSLWSTRSQKLDTIRKHDIRQYSDYESSEPYVYLWFVVVPNDQSLFWIYLVVRNIGFATQL